MPLLYCIGNIEAGMPRVMQRSQLSKSSGVSNGMSCQLLRIVADFGQRGQSAVRRIHDQRCLTLRNLTGLGPVALSEPARGDLPVVAGVARLDGRGPLGKLLVREIRAGAALDGPPERRQRHVPARPAALHVPVP